MFLAEQINNGALKDFIVWCIAMGVFGIGCIIAFIPYAHGNNNAQLIAMKILTVAAIIMMLIIIVGFFLIPN